MSNQYAKIKGPIALSVDTAPKTGKSATTALNWTNRSMSMTRKDVADWKSALSSAENVDNPNNMLLQNLYQTVNLDGMLSSQIENRRSKVFNVDFNLVNTDGEKNEEQTNILLSQVPWREITKAITDTIFYEYSLIQLNYKPTIEGVQLLVCEDIPKANVLPQKGRFIPDVTDTEKFMEYRNMKEYGIWVLEFGGAQRRGLINKAVPHVLMKSFAQSCWAELCEIYGIPPRVMKTNTHDPAMVRRAEQMMKDMSAAAWFVIDETEDFTFASGTYTSGDVYNKLIQTCNNELTMLISGAVVGQDTKNGSRAKDEVAQGVLWELVMQDLVLVEDNWNNIVLPALRKLGIIKGDVKLKFDIPEDLPVIWERVKDTVSSFDFDIDWLNDKFGLKITGAKQQAPTPGNLQLGEGFFV